MRLKEFIKEFFKKEEKEEKEEKEKEKEKEEKEKEKERVEEELQKKVLQEKCPHDKEFISEECIKETRYKGYIIMGPNTPKEVTLNCKKTCQICGRTNLVYLGDNAEEYKKREYLYEKIDGYTIESIYHGYEYYCMGDDISKTYGFLSKIPTGILRTKAETNELLETIKIQKEKEKEKEREEKLREEQEKAEKAREEAKKKQEKLDAIRKKILEE